MYNSRYQITLRDGTKIPNLSFHECEEMKNNCDWLYIDTMEGIKIKEMMKSLPKGVRMTTY